MTDLQITYMKLPNGVQNENDDQLKTTYVFLPYGIPEKVEEEFSVEYRPNESFDDRCKHLNPIVMEKRMDTNENMTSEQDQNEYNQFFIEVKSGKLQWSPLLKSEKFWRENAARFNENQFEVIRILISLLEMSTDPLILCIACHNIGEYVKHYQEGNTVLAKFQGEQAITRLLTHDDPKVRHHALLANQTLEAANIMKSNKQLNSDKEVASPTTDVVKQSQDEQATMRLLTLDNSIIYNDALPDHQSMTTDQSDKQLDGKEETPKNK